MNQQSVEVQEPPFAVQIELTEGCNLRCHFCGLNGIRGTANNLKFMTVELAERLATMIREAGWNPRIEFAMHGEPTLNPNMLAILRTFRMRLPRRIHLMMTSNGGGLLKDTTQTIDEMLKYLNVLALDWYENVQIVPNVLKRYEGLHQPLYYPQNKEANPHRRMDGHRWVIIQDIAKADEGTHATLNNHAGAGSPPNTKGHGKRCAKPFRELSVRWDGGVAICCNDWRGEYVCGNLSTQTLDEVWNGQAMRAARRYLVTGDRAAVRPCNGCDATSYRVGLLPDHRGKATLPAPTPADEQAVAAALAAGPLTQPVRRPWELPVLPS